MCLCFGKKLQIFDFQKLEMGEGQANELSYKKGVKNKVKKIFALEVSCFFLFLLKLIRLVDSRSLSRRELEQSKF